MGRHDEPEVVFIERDDGGSALKWLVVGAALGAGLALLFAPRSGSETRAELQRGARRVRDLAADAVEDLRESFGGASGEDRARAMADSGGAYGEDEDLDEDPELEAGAAGAAAGRRERPSLRTARDELEQRLAAARARRRQPAVPEHGDPVA
jgi:hypothetical protein